MVRIATVLVAVVASSAIVVLAIENARLKRGAAPGSAPGTPIVQIRAGDQLPATKLRPVDTLSSNDAGDVGLREMAAGSTTLLYVVTSVCPYCARSLPRLEQLGARLAVEPVRMLGVVLDGQRLERDDLRKPAGPWRLFTRKDVQAAVDLGVVSVPTTMLADPRGTVRHVWIGEVDETRAQEIEESVRRLLSATK